MLLSLTASHRELDLDALERLSTGSGSLARTIAGACEPVRGAVVISTCNRFELYLDVEAPVTGPAIDHTTTHAAQLVAAASGVAVDAAARCLTVRVASEVPEHLFAVASGLDSMVIGEREVAGQVKRALEVAREERTTSKTLELLFQTASRTSKRVGSSTALGTTGRSIVKVALDLAADSLPPWHAASTIIIGTGSYAGATVAALRARGAGDIRVYSQSGRAELFAAGHDVAALPVGEEALVEALAEADLVVSVSGARGRGRAPVEPGEPGPEAALEFVLDAAAVARARVRAAERADARDGFAERGTPRPLVVLDLALHRDVDPALADVEGVQLYDLQSLKAHAPATATAVVADARALVDAAAREFVEHQVGRAADAAVMALLDEAEREVDAEVAAAVDRLRDELRARGEAPEPDESDVEKISTGIRKRIHTALHARIVAARAEAVAQARAAGQDVVDAARRAADAPAPRR